MSFSYGKCFSLFCSLTKKVSGLLWSNIQSWRDWGIQKSNIKPLKCSFGGGGGGKKSSQPTFILIFTIILIILKESFSMETKNTILKLFYFSHPYLLSYRFTPTKILKKKISHCITSQNPFFVILHCFVAWLVFCTPLSFISEGSSFSIRYFLLYYSHYLAFTVLGEGGESLSQI